MARSSMFRHSGHPVFMLTVDQIQQRKQVDPDNVDEVPIQTCVFNGRVILRRIAPRHARNVSSRKCPTPMIMCRRACRSWRNKGRRKSGRAADRIAWSGYPSRISPCKLKCRPGNVVLFKFSYHSTALIPRKARPRTMVKQRDDQQPALSASARRGRRARRSSCCRSARRC